MNEIRKLYDMHPKTKIFFTKNQVLLFEKLMGRFIDIKKGVNLFKCDYYMSILKPDLDRIR